MSTASVGDVDLYYEKYGQGPPVCSSMDWPVIAVRGTPKSPAWSATTGS